VAAETFTVEVQSNIKEVLATDLPALIKAARKVVGGRGRKVQGAIRSEIRRAGLRERLASAIRHKAIDIPDGIESTVFSRARAKPYTDASGAGRHEVVDLAALLQAEQVVVGTVRRLVAIPLPIAGQGPRGRAARVSDFPVGFFRAIFRGDHGVLVPKDAGPHGQAFFILTPHTHRAKFLSTSKSWERYATEGLSERIFDEWSRHRVAIALQRVA
jgi:hypothetical protein